MKLLTVGFAIVVVLATLGWYFDDYLDEKNDCSDILAERNEIVKCNNAFQSCWANCAKYDNTRQCLGKCIEKLDACLAVID